MQPRVTGVPETFLIPLWARAFETKRPGGIIQDPKAVEMLERIDYNFDKFRKAKLSQVGIAIRTMLLDNAARSFIAKHANAVILNLGAGLGARFSRMDNGSILWYDLDLPESIEVRRNFFADSDRCKMIAKSVFDYTWINDIGCTKEPVLIIAEGLFMYFDEAQVKELLDRLKAAFPNGEMLLETVSVFMSRNTKHHDSVTTTGAVFKWGADSAKDLHALMPSLTVRDEWSFFKNLQKGQGNWLVRLISAIPMVDRKVGNRIFDIVLT